MSERWDVRRAGPYEAAHRVLMIPGGLCTTEFYADVMAEPAVAELGLVAVTMPGLGDTEAPEDVSRTLARCFTLQGGGVGHRAPRGPEGRCGMAEIALSDNGVVGPTAERAGSQACGGRVRPTLTGRRWPVKQEPMVVPRSGTDRNPLPSGRGGRQYEYLDRYPSLVPRPREVGISAWGVRGDHDERGLAGGERRGLEACPHVRMVTVPEAGHPVLVEQPARVADVIVGAVAAVRCIRGVSDPARITEAGGAAWLTSR